MPIDVPSPIEWVFDQAQPDWVVAAPWNPEVEPATITSTTDSLRVTLTDDTRNLEGVTRGGLVVAVPDLEIRDWGFIEVRARTSDQSGFVAGFNLREGQGTAAEQPYALSRS